MINHPRRVVLNQNDPGPLRDGETFIANGQFDQWEHLPGERGSTIEFRRPLENGFAVHWEIEKTI